MKILIFLRKWEGGVGVVMGSIKKELEKKGNEVICVSRENDLKSFSSIKNLFWLRRRYKKIIKKENPDIIYTQDWSMALPLTFPIKIFKERHFCCFHGNQFWKTKLMQRLIGKFMGKNLIVVGDSLKKNFKKSTLVYNGVDLDLFKPLNKKRDSLGWMDKETETLNEKEIRELSKKLRLKPLILKNFEIPFDKMNEEFYNKCQVFISFPPKTAGFNLCWIEAMAAGVPKIIGNNEGVGWKLDIDKFEDKKTLLKEINHLEKKEYRKQIENSELIWENHVNKLLECWRK